MMQKFPVCSVSDIELGKKKRFMVNGKALMVAHVDDGFYATDDTCSHAQASMTAGVLEGHEIECPRHGSRFDIRTGEALTLPAVMPLATYKVLIEGDKIFVEMEANEKNDKSVPQQNTDDAAQTAEKKEPTTDAKPPFEVICEGGVCRIVRPKKV